MPAHLRTLARLDGETTFDLNGSRTIAALLDAIEERYPMLRGTIRDQGTRKRRPYVRYFACERDLSHETPDTALPDRVISGSEPFLIVGAIAGG